MAHAIFHKRLHIAQFITAVVALTFHMIGLNRLFLDQHVDRIGQLDFIPGSRRRFASTAKCPRSAHSDQRQQG